LYDFNLYLLFSIRRFQMQTLRQGSRQAHVIMLQRLLNEVFVNDHSVQALDEDGVFGRLTDQQVRLAQSRGRMPDGRPLVVDGVVGTNTWRALGLQIEVLWPMPTIGQSTGMSCWSVAQGLASGRLTSVQPMNAELGSAGGLLTDLPNLDNYAAESGMRLLPSVPTVPELLLPHLRRGPIILIGDWMGGGQHAVVISGYMQGGSAYSTMIQIHNPLPVGLGSVSVTDYPLMQIQGGGAFSPYALIVK
jgi:hypothetical protein